jgi:hypothetical protein
MKRPIAAVALALSAMLATGAPALADRFEPHMPDFLYGYCPGGRGIQPDNAITCDGVPYADGSHWRYTWFAVPAHIPQFPAEARPFYGLHCVIADELVPSSFAPPGGCDGAV